MPRVTLTLKEKKKLLEDYDNLPRSSTAEKARKLNVKRSTLLAILKNRTSITHRYSINDKHARKSMRAKAYVDFD